MPARSWRRRSAMPLLAPGPAGASDPAPGGGGGAAAPAGGGGRAGGVADGNLGAADLGDLIAGVDEEPRALAGGGEGDGEGAVDGELDGLGIEPPQGEGRHRAEGERAVVAELDVDAAVAGGERAA